MSQVLRDLERQKLEFEQMQRNDARNLRASWANTTPDGLNLVDLSSEDEQMSPAGLRDGYIIKENFEKAFKDGKLVTKFIEGEDGERIPYLTFENEELLLQTFNSNPIIQTYTDRNTGAKKKGMVSHIRIGANDDGTPNFNEISFLLDVPEKRGPLSFIRKRPKTYGFDNNPNAPVVFTSFDELYDAVNLNYGVARRVEGTGAGVADEVQGVARQTNRMGAMPTNNQGSQEGGDGDLLDSAKNLITQLQQGDIDPADAGDIWAEMAALYGSASEQQDANKVTTAEENINQERQEQPPVFNRADKGTVFDPLVETDAPLTPTVDLNLTGRDLFLSLPNSLGGFKRNRKGNDPYHEGSVQPSLKSNNPYYNYIQLEGTLPFGMSQEQFNSLSEIEQKAVRRNAKALSKVNEQRILNTAIWRLNGNPRGFDGEKQYTDYGFLNPKTRNLTDEELADRKTVRDWNKKHSKGYLKKYFSDNEAGGNNRLLEFANNPLAFIKANPELRNPRVEGQTTEQTTGTGAAVPGAGDDNVTQVSDVSNDIFAQYNLPAFPENPAEQVQWLKTNAPQLLQASQDFNVESKAAEIIERYQINNEGDIKKAANEPAGDKLILAMGIAKYLPEKDFQSNVEKYYNFMTTEDFSVGPQTAANYKRLYDAEQRRIDVEFQKLTDEATARGQEASQKIIEEMTNAVKSFYTTTGGTQLVGQVNLGGNSPQAQKFVKAFQLFMTTGGPNGSGLRVARNANGDAVIIPQGDFTEQDLETWRNSGSFMAVKAGFGQYLTNRMANIDKGFVQWLGTLGSPTYTPNPFDNMQNIGVVTKFVNGREIVDRFVAKDPAGRATNYEISAGELFDDFDETSFAFLRMITNPAISDFAEPPE